MQFLLTHVDSLLVGGIDHENDGCCVGVVASPVWSDTGLSSEIPHVEFEVLVGEGLHVETNGGDGIHNLTKLQPVQNGGLAGTIQSNDEDSDLLVASPHTAEHAS